MKFQITMKDPDGVYDSKQQAVEDSLEELDISEQEKEALMEMRMAEVDAGLSKWFRYGEYVTIEVDTDAGTAVVVPRG